MAGNPKALYAIGNGDMYDGNGEPANLIDELRGVSQMFSSEMIEHILDDAEKSANTYTDTQCAKLKDWAQEHLPKVIEI